MNKYLVKVLMLVVGMAAGMEVNATQTGLKIEYTDFSERLDNDEKFVERKMVTYKKTWDTTKRTGSDVLLNYHANVGAGFGQYRGGTKGESDNLSLTAFESAISTEHCLTVGIDKNGFVPEIGLSGKVLVKRINHRFETSIDAVAGVSYKKDDTNMGLRYMHNLHKMYYYPHNVELHGVKIEPHSLTQTGGNSIAVFFEKQHRVKTHGLEFGYQQSPKGPSKEHGGGWSSYEPKSRQYTIAYYQKF